MLHSHHARAFALLLTAGAAAFGGSIVVPPGTSQVTVTGTVPTTQVDNFFVYHFVDSNGVVKEGTSAVSTIPANVPLSATFSIPASVSSGYATFVGLYSLSPGLVTVALNSTAAGTALGNAFESVFTGTTETSLAAAIAGQAATSGSGTTALLAFLNANSTLFPQFNGLGTSVSVSNVKFSNGTADGTLAVSILSGPAVSATPEPSSLLLAAPVLGFMLRKLLKERV